MHFSHSKDSAPSDSTGRGNVEEEDGDMLFITLSIHLLHLRKQAKMNRNRPSASPEGRLWMAVFSSSAQLRDVIVQPTKRELQQTPSNNLIYSFESKTELFKISNYEKVDPLPWSDPNVSILPPFVHPFICFITSALILEQSWLLLQALSPERLLSLSSCSLIPETLLLCFPTS